ncbi:hypothetical protein BHE74_00037686 [Ensete ventricosum]|nr:hypothetical protein BHE74_00037686 [Ensete ventricosum]
MNRARGRACRASPREQEGGGALAGEDEARGGQGDGPSRSEKSAVGGLGLRPCVKQRPNLRSDRRERSGRGLKNRRGCAVRKGREREEEEVEEEISLSMKLRKQAN